MTTNPTPSHTLFVIGSGHNLHRVLPPVLLYLVLPVPMNLPQSYISVFVFSIGDIVE